MNTQEPMDNDRLLLVHHAANRGHDYPPNSLAGLRYCLEAGALVVEVDINPLRGGDFALLHDDLLGGETDGSGPVAAATADQVRSLRYKRRGTLTDEHVGLLSEALALIRGYTHFRELQLDLKISPALTDAALEHLLHMLEPAKELVRVTSGADWTLRRLRALDADLALGFDPLLYLEMGDPGEEVPPFRQGAYGYWDDHPLAARRWGTTAEYLAARAEALWVQAPAHAIWYIHALLLERAAGDGFDWVAYLHERATPVDAWTLDVGKPGHPALARRLAAVGVDRITTNDAPRLAAVLDEADSNHPADKNHPDVDEVHPVAVDF
jgi:glycerophosphoryl diester phosphodiesterase